MASRRPPASRRARAPLRVEILGTGDELVRGRSRDTNFGRIASLLTDLGHEVVGGRIVGDDLGDLVEALRRAAGRADAVIMTGGLGPTADDLTRDAAARLLKVPLVEHGPSLRRIRGMWRRRGIPMPPSNALQALHPRGSEILPNLRGTAPGVRWKLLGADVFCLPGPPREMEPILVRSVIPALRRRAGGKSPTRTLYASCCGVSESAAAERIADLMARDRPVKVGTTAAAAVITVSIHGTGEAASLVPAVHREVLRRMEEDAYAGERIPPGENLVRLLLERKLTVSVAESCTAGLVAARLADRPGSSGALLGGVVAYSNEVKRKVLGVPSRLLRLHGAVSGPVAEAMAKGARKLTGSDLAVAVTGVAGPDGGTARKPVGLVWFAVADRRGVRSVSRRFGGGRDFVRSAAAATAIDLVRRAVQRA